MPKEILNYGPEGKRNFGMAMKKLKSERALLNLLCGLVVRVSCCRVRFPALPDFMRSRVSGTGSTQPREDK
jgi:hypothetical protein